MGIDKLIESRRKELGLTLEEVGKAVGVGKSTVKKWESGYISNMRRDKIALLAEVLQIPPTDLIFGKNAEEIAGDNNHEEHYYIDPETRQIAQEIHDNADMRGLFDIARDTSPERLRAYCDFLKQLHGQDKSDD